MQRVLAFVVVLLLFGYTVTSAQSAKKAPTFSLKAADGTVVDLAKLKGKVVMVNFWATWCPPCRAEIPDFMKVYDEYKSKGLEIIGVSLDQDGWDDVRPFLKKNPINYPIVIGDGKLAQAYGGVEAIPTTFFIDKAGNIVTKHIGGMRKTALEGYLKNLL